MSFISELHVSLNRAEERQFREQGFKKIFTDLNEGAGGNTIYLWYKKGEHPVTRIQFSFNEEMTRGLTKAGYQHINKNLNEGTGGNPIYLWYFKGNTKYDVPIQKLDVSTQAHDEPHKYKLGWERLACDLNRKAGGSWIHLWVKRKSPTYICDIKATVGWDEDCDNFQDGYIRVDENTNRGAWWWQRKPLPSIFIWYRQTTKKEGAITELQVSTNPDEEKSFQDQGYALVNQDLNKETGGSQVFLWYKKDPGRNPIKAVSVLVNRAHEKVYENQGIPVIDKNLNDGNKGAQLYLCYYQ